MSFSIVTGLKCHFCSSVNISDWSIYFIDWQITFKNGPAEQ